MSGSSVFLGSSQSDSIEGVYELSTIKEQIATNCLNLGKLQVVDDRYPFVEIRCDAKDSREQSE